MDRPALDVKELPSSFMNEDHREFALMLDHVEREVADSSYEAIDQSLRGLIGHTKAHFERENEAMQALNHFPPYEAHKGEHDRVIQGLNLMFDTWKETRDREQLRAGLANLWAWFDIHLETMDTVTAHFIARS
jgi:hemerythrin